MPFKFKHLVQLLQELDAARRKVQEATTSHLPKSLQPDLQDETRRVIREWFERHDSDIVRYGPSAVALLSCLLLDRLPHRVYFLQETKLADVLCKVFGLNPKQGGGWTLHQWRTTNLDFATCLEMHILRHRENLPPLAENEVTLEQIDDALQKLVGRSASKLKAEDILRRIFLRLHSSEAKWLVRIILKSYNPVEIPEDEVLNCFHFLLPRIMPLRNSITEAIEILGQPKLTSISYDTLPALRRQHLQACAEHVKPKLGIQIQRQEFEQARGIGNCCRLAGQRTMSVERKYDGWYVQVHVDLSKQKDQRIHLISKRGKDLTTAAFDLHDAIEAGLRLNQPDCVIVRNCVVEVEMLVWDRKNKTIEQFYKLRKHVQIRNKTIGTAMDSPKSADEHLMAIFHDCLMLDDQNMTFEPHHMRRQELERVVEPVEGLAQLGERRVINFGSPNGKKELMKFFAYAIAENWEGLVLKGCHDSYFSTCWYNNAIKLKKDYIKGLGDRVDLCIIGGRRDFADGERIGGSLRWTTLHLACLKNKEDVLRHKADPVFLVLDEVAPPCIPMAMLDHLNKQGIGRYVNYADKSAKLDVEIDQVQLQKNPPSHLFQKPFVVEAYGAGYERPQNASYYALRFARVDKMHFDRGVIDTHSFDELQELAKKSFEPPDAEEQEEQDWYKRLVDAEPKKDQHIYLPSQSQETPSPVHDSPGSFTSGTPTPSAHKRLDLLGLPLPPTPLRQQVEEKQLEHDEPESILVQSPSCASTASPDSCAPGSSTAKPALLKETPASPLTVTALAETALAAAAGFSDDDSHSQSTATPSPEAILSIKAIEASFVKPPPRARKRSATAPVQGTKRKHQPGRSDLPPETVKLLKENNYTGPFDDKRAIAVFMSKHGLYPNRKPQTTPQPPTKIRRRAKSYVSPRKPRPLAELENVSLTHGLQKVADGLKSPDKTSNNKSHVAEEHAKRKKEPEVIDLTLSPEKEQSATGPAMKETSLSNSTPVKATQSPPTPTNVIQAPTTPSRLLDTIILEILQHHPLVEQLHKSEHNVICVKLRIERYTPKLEKDITPILLDIRNQYKALASTSTAIPVSLTQQRMIYFFNKGVRPSVFESSPQTKTPRRILSKYESWIRTAEVVMMSVDAGQVDVVCQRIWDRYEAEDQLEKLRTEPDKFFVKP